MKYREVRLTTGCYGEEATLYVAFPDDFTEQKIEEFINARAIENGEKYGFDAEQKIDRKEYDTEEEYYNAVVDAENEWCRNLSGVATELSQREWDTRRSRILYKR